MAADEFGNLAGDLVFHGHAFEADRQRIETVNNVVIALRARFDVGRPITKTLVHTGGPQIGRFDHMAVSRDISACDSCHGVFSFYSSSPYRPAALPTTIW